MINQCGEDGFDILHGKGEFGSGFGDQVGLKLVGWSRCGSRGDRYAGKEQEGDK